MKKQFDAVSIATSKHITRKYSTSFSLGIYCLAKNLRNPIYSIYGFVRLADEIVDSFHGFDKKHLLSDFRQQTYQAIAQKISINPVLNSFQQVVHAHNIGMDLIDCFLDSMEMDLDMETHSPQTYEQYILGSAQVVGLMCLRVFTEGDEEMYERLKESAMKLGAAFQKVNFLRDIRDDNVVLGRVYFPAVNIYQFSDSDKIMIEQDIEADFLAALKGIRSLPASSRFGVYTAYVYYRKLFHKIKQVPPSRILNQRIRIPDYQKMNLLAVSYLKNSLSLI